MKAKERYYQWLEDAAIDHETKKILRAMSDEEITDAFYKELEFGTAGVRGILGVGSNRMNIYVISRISYSFGLLICSGGVEAKQKGVVIAYDTRHKSIEFALKSALIMCAMGIKVYLYDNIRATPQLSFSVRELKAQAGIMITASHNPKEYNGLKAYWDDGAQILPAIAKKIEATIKSIEDFGSINTITEIKARKKGLLLTPGPEIDDNYINKVRALSLNDNIDKNISIVYTPLNGTGSIPVMRILKERGFSRVLYVKEQMEPDPDFTTAPFPNPEDERAFEYAIELGKKNDASILIANDPDCDRTAIMVHNGERYIAFNGNQTGAILIKYIMDALVDKNEIPDKPMIVKSIVTGDLGKVIAKDYGVETFEALTGFKNICGVAIEKEEEGYKFLFGYEESIGYTAGTFVRDKDGVISSMLICEAAAYYMKRSLTLYDIMQQIYREYGYYIENNFFITLKGREGSEKIIKIMESLRKNIMPSLIGKRILAVIDYEKKKKTDLKTGDVTSIDIPTSNVLKFVAEGDLWFSIRPSGTEPKIKIYIYGKSSNYNDAKKIMDDARKEITNLIYRSVK